MSDAITEALEQGFRNLGGKVLERWKGAAGDVFDKMTPEERQLAFRVAERSAKIGTMSLLGKDMGERWLNVKAQLKAIEVGGAIDIRDGFERAFWDSVELAFTDGVAMLAKIIKAAAK